MSLAFKVVIPARYGSSRLPGKPLLDLDGEPMIAHVCRRAEEAGATCVVVATDDARIAEAVALRGWPTVLTGAHHQSGSERINEAAALLGWSDNDIIVNLQGDEPLVPPSLIRRCAGALSGQSAADVATLATPVSSQEELFNPNAVKVVLDQNGYALYFSRAPIPWDRAHFPGQFQAGQQPHLRHIGLYAYSVGFLKRYCSWEASTLETMESLEQLRILWHGEKIRVEIVDAIPEAGVDTAEDLERVKRKLLQLRTGAGQS